MRGNRGYREFQLVPLRSIPACAGEPQALNVDCLFRYGLSPRVRGNQQFIRGVNVDFRSIPACAGEPIRKRCLAQSKSVYPRVCGGTISNPAIPACHSGLSPRVRGNLKSGGSTATNNGSIPACAGEPCLGMGRLVKDRVYPRVCGGTSSSGSASAKIEGLSPRVRGNPPCLLPASNPNRSIPACAGEPAHTCSGPGRASVYPRVCGGTYTIAVCMSIGKGLSPRVRGNLRLGVHVAAAVRSIPACAGEPRALPACSPFSTVYPRVCGGTTVMTALVDAT